MTNLVYKKQGRKPAFALHYLLINSLRDYGLNHQTIPFLPQKTVNIVQLVGFMSHKAR
jgi:hypothetical protein